MKTKLFLLALLATAAWSQCIITNPDPRVWIGTYAGGTSYALCNVVYDSVDAKAYVSIQAANLGHQPDTSNTWWTLLYSAPVNLQSSDTLKGSHLALDYNLAWLRANGTGAPGATGATGATGSTGATGPAPAGTGIVAVVGGVPSARALTSADLPANPVFTGIVTVVTRVLGQASDSYVDPLLAGKAGAVAGTGVVGVTGGVPALIAGTASNCVLVSGGSGPCGGGSMVYPATPGVAIMGASLWGTSVPASTTVNGQACALGGVCTIVAAGAANIFTAPHAGFTAYSNPASSVTGIVSYTDYSAQAATVYRGPGIAVVTEPMSMNRAMVSVTSAFQAAIGAPSISGLQISLGTATNSTAYMNPVQVGYSLTTVAPLTTCSAAAGVSGQPTFVVDSPVAFANQNTALVVSGVAQAAYNTTFTGTWTTSTTFVTTSPAITCATYTISSNGMAGLQGLIYGNFTALPQGMSGTNTVYLYLTETNTNPANFLGNLLAGAVKVMLEGVQVQ